MRHHHWKRLPLPLGVVEVPVPPREVSMELEPLEEYQGVGSVGGDEPVRVARGTYCAWSTGKCWGAPLELVEAPVSLKDVKVPPQLEVALIIISLKAQCAFS